MLAIVPSATLHGLEGRFIRVEVDVAPGQDGHHRQNARDGPDLPAERELADQCQPIRSRHDLLRTEEDPDRHGEIERRAGFALFGRSEVDRDPTRRMDEPGIPDCTANPLAGLLERGVGQAHDRESGQAARNVDLDPDHPAVEADDRCGQQRGKHAPTVPAVARRRLTERLSGD